MFASSFPMVFLSLFISSVSSVGVVCSVRAEYCILLPPWSSIVWATFSLSLSSGMSYVIR